MALPQAIQAQVDQADAMLKAMNAPAAPETPETPETAQPEAVEPQPQAVTPPAPEPQQKPDIWEQRYKSLQGRYNNEVPNLQRQVQELEGRLSEAVSKLEQAAAAKPEVKESKPVADPQDVEAFGADLVDMVQRVAERMFGTAARNIQEQAVKFEQRLARVEDALQGTTQTVAMTAEQTFFDRLAKQVPEWEQVNVDESFLDWLREIDPVYGLPRQAALADAQRKLDADRAAAVFKAFLATTAPAAPKPNAVEKQVSPKASASSAPPAPNAKPILSAKEVNDFYNDVARGRYKGREAEAKRIEQTINAAMAEGRIR